MEVGLARDRLNMAVETIHTYCAHSKSRSGVIYTVEKGILKKVEPDPEHPNGCICVKGIAAPGRVSLWQGEAQSETGRGPSPARGLSPARMVAIVQEPGNAWLRPLRSQGGKHQSPDPQ